ncbi:MAG: hypothetical protein GF334_03375 [Candidatus Altiarchaeales archaeon]|nr:hypothetical protein [Candidatus Altiarchaeales archaeon]
MPVNIQINDGNFSFGPESGFFYTISSSLDSLVQVEADGTVVNTFPISRSQLRNPVIELHYDGTFFWTLEELPSDLGMVIKKWRLFPFKTAAFPSVSPSELRWQDELTLLNKPNIIYQGEAFAIEHYHRTFDSSETQGSTSIRLDDASKVSPGTTLYLGPSSFGGFEGNEEKIVVQSVNPTTGDVSFVKQGGLENSYTSGDPIDFHTGIWFFNDHSFSGQSDNLGVLSRFAYPSKNLVRSDSGAKYSKVTAADFDGSKISFIRGPMLMTINIDTVSFDLESSLEANLIENNKYELIKVYDLISDLDNNLFYKLQQRETSEDLGTGSLTTDDFSPQFNFQTETDLPFVNSVSLRFEPSRFAITGSSPRTRGFTVFAELRDQFNLPVLGETVQFSASQSDLGDSGIPGTMNPAVDFTNVSGTARSVYTPSSTTNDFLVDIEADVL